MALSILEGDQPSDLQRSRNAKRSGLACTACKRSKRRCDIERQVVDSFACTNCRLKGQACEVRFGEDKRRRRTASKHFRVGTDAQLFNNLAALQSDQDVYQTDSPDAEAPLTPKTSRRPPVEALLSSSSTVTRQNLASHDTVWANTHDRVESSSSGQRHPEDDSAHARVQSRTAKTGNPGGMPLEARFDAALLTTSDGIDVLEGRSETTSASIIDRVLARKDTLEGQTNEGSEFFGSTSIYHLFASHRSEAPSGVSTPKAGEAGQSPMIEMDPEFDPSNEPEPVVMHLLNLFWTWQAIHLQVVHRGTFLAEKARFDTGLSRRRYKFFSPALLYAIMSLSSLLSTDRGVRYHSAKAGDVAGDIYFAKARKLFDKDLSHPTLTTVQTALILASRYGCTSQSPLGWIFSGTAIRMAVQLGLHVDCNGAVAANQMSNETAEVRRLVWWGCYVQDKLWSAYTGRPSSIVDYNITVELPQARSNSTVGLPDADEMVTTVYEHIVVLTIKCSQILTELYSNKNRDNTAFLRKAASRIHTELLTWHRDLPISLRWPNDSNAPTSPHVSIMHMQFYFTILLLHRPFIDPNEVLTSITNLCTGPLSTTSICTLAATNTAKLARDYSRFYSLKQIASPAIHFIFMAATVHVINYQISRDENHEYLFRGCLSSLSEIAEAYPMGTVATSALRDLQTRLMIRQHKQSQPSSRTSHTPRLTIGSPRQKLSYKLKGQVQKTFGASLDLSTMSPPLSPPVDVLGDATTGRLPTNETFDWSKYDSPIVNPPSLNIFDIDTLQETGHLINPSPQQFLVSDDFIFADEGSVLSRYPTAPSVLQSDGNLPSTAFFDSFYGTTFGLNCNGFF